LQYGARRGRYLGGRGNNAANQHPLGTSVPTSQFKLLAGDGAQTDYQFGRHTMHHLFCTKCGIHAFGTYAADGQEKVIVNLRCLEGIDPDKLEVQTFDGKSYR